jgi:tripartite-type tricarboxylate transporter receptor subunit TctC
MPIFHLISIDEGKFIMNHNQYLPQSLQIIIVFMMSLASTLLNAQIIYPEKAVTLVVPYGPGGMGDRLARLSSEKLYPSFKQPLIVENKPGGNGSIGGRVVVNAKPDGHTLLVGQTGEIIVNRLLMRDLGYDALKDLIPVVLMGNAPLVIVAPMDASFNNLTELIQLAKKNTNALSYASLGQGTPGHLAAVALEIGTNSKMVHVPYKGISNLLPDLLSGRVNLFFSSTSTAIPLIKSGKLKVIAVTTPKRIGILPQIETVAESLPGFSFTVWGGLFAPKATPKPIIDQLNREINLFLSNPDVKNQLEADSIAVPINTVSEFQEFVQIEANKYEKLIKQAQIKLE